MPTRRESLRLSQIAKKSCERPLYRLLIREFTVIDAHSVFRESLCCGVRVQCCKELVLGARKYQEGLPPDAHSAIDPNKPKWSPAELQKSLQRLQQLTALGEVSGLAESSLTERISSELKAKHPEADKMLDGDQEQTLDVVDRFFTSMVSSEKITDQVKTQLNKLQVPVVKLLLGTNCFLSARTAQ